MKLIPFTTPRLSAAMPLIFGLATIAAAPTVGAVTIESVDIIGGMVDVTQGGLINGADDALDVALWCNDAAPIRVDIINGFVDLDEDGVLGEAAEDIVDCDLNDETDGPAGDNNGIPTSNPVNILNGRVDVTQGGVINASDAATDVQLFKLP